MVSTPYMDEAERCTRVGFLNQGKLVAPGRPEDLRYIRGTILEVFAEQRFDAKAALAGLPFVTSVNLFGEGLHVTTEDGDSETSEIHVRSCWRRRESKFSR